LVALVFALACAVSVNAQCAQQMDQSKQCMQSLFINDPNQARKDQIFQQCLGAAAAQCTQQRQVMQRCRTQAQNDPNVLGLKQQMQTAVDSCFRQYPSTNTGSNIRFRDSGNDDDGDDVDDVVFVPRAKRHGGFGKLPACQGTTTEQQTCVSNAMQQLKNDPNVQAQKQQMSQQKQACKNQVSTQCRPGSADTNLCNCLCTAKQAYKQAKQNAMQTCAQQQGVTIPASGRQMTCGNGCQRGFGR